VVHAGAHQHWEHEDRFPETRATRQQSSPPERQSATGDVVESLDSVADFFHDRQVSIVVHFVSNLQGSRGDFFRWNLEPSRVWDFLSNSANTFSVPDP
jgi:hypothetical protein